MLLQLAATAGKRAFQRRTLRRPHPARREVTCGDSDMDWPRLGAVLHTTWLCPVWLPGVLGGFHQGLLSREQNGGEKRRSYPQVRGNGAASVTPASSSRPLLTQYTGRNWLNAEIVESCEGVRCHPASSSADVCQRVAVRQRMGAGNTPGGVSPHPQGARLALRLVRQGDGLHYPVGQPLFGDSLPFLLPSVADKKLLRASDAPGAVHVFAQCSYGTQQR